MIYDVQTSSAMNYYEELGVAPEATEHEIRKAHRRLVKLMHPDAQPDQNLKMLAETQMRRLNSISSTLLDPDQRRIYDEQLLAATQTEHSKPPSIPGLGGVPWWIASVVGAVVLTLAAVWLWADHMGSAAGRSRTAVYIPPADQTPVLVSPSVSYQPPASPMHASDPNPSELQPPGNGVSTAIVPDILPDPKPASRAQPVSPPPTPKPKQAQVAGAPPLPVPKKPLTKQVAAPPSLPKPPPKVESQKVEGNKNLVPPQSKASDPKATLAHNTDAKTVSLPVPAPKKSFSLPPDGAVVARAANSNSKSGAPPLPPPPGVNAPAGHDYNGPALLASNLPTAVPPRLATVTTGVSPATTGHHDSLEGEWIYAPKEPEKRKAGFYPPEFIDLKLFGAGDPGSLKGQYSAKYVVTDRPVSSEVSFELASVSKGSRRFIWQSNNGAKGTLSIDPIDERTIRIDWRTTSAVRGPALTSGTATLVRRQ